MKKTRHHRGGYQVAGKVQTAGELRESSTSAESVLWARLRGRRFLGFKFRRQHQFGDYIAHFYCHDAQLVIECDGTVHNSNDSRFHDENRDVYMLGQGLRVLRFKNEQVLTDTESVLAEIARYLVGKKNDD